ncbi:hypothetical protein [Streptomyces alfalfae]|uniref:Uncharacterized protein n=1 Tax=Streptomyces alfalfae TaxID=1642299 RepID=A0A7T4PDF2_9ACTN|nr:hypothetical protein [Streptomyces alfalfae]QQC88182.1 hypothetical protein I8755_06975 [Streptomyces alfalfae]
MTSNLTVSLADASAEHSRTLLGHDFDAWLVAGILAVVVAVAYEVMTALLRQVSLRIPFLVLYLAKLTVPGKDWMRLSPRWKGELWAILSQPSTTSRPVRFLKGILYAAPLALGAARVTAKALTTTRPAAKKTRRRIVAIRIGTPSGGDWLRVAGFALATWGVYLAPPQDLKNRILVASLALFVWIGQVVRVLVITREEDTPGSPRDTD